MKLSFASNSGVYKQCRYEEEQQIINTISGRKFAITCFGNYSMVEYRLLQYGTLVGNIELTDDILKKYFFNKDSNKKYTLTCSNFKNRVMHFAYKEAMKYGYFDYDVYKTILKTLNIIRWYKIRGLDIRTIKNRLTTMHWLVNFEWEDTLTLPTIEFVDFNYVRIFGLENVIKLDDFIRIYMKYAIKKLELENVIKIEDVNKNNFFKLVESMLALVNETNILKFNIGGNSHEELNELVKEYKPVGNELTQYNQKLSLTMMAKIPQSERKFKGCLYQGYEMRPKTDEKRKYLYVKGYETIGLKKITKELYGDIDIAFFEIYNVFVPWCVVDKIKIDDELKELY